MVKIELTDQELTRATNYATNTLPLWRQNVFDTPDNWRQHYTGLVGEIAVAKLFKWTLDQFLTWNRAHLKSAKDIRLYDLDWNVKTLELHVLPKPVYYHHVIKQHHVNYRDEIHGYIFVYYRYDLKTAFIMGFIEYNRFGQVAREVEKGKSLDTAPNNFKAHAHNLTIQNKELDNIGTTCIWLKVV